MQSARHGNCAEDIVNTHKTKQNVLAIFCVYIISSFQQYSQWAITITRSPTARSAGLKEDAVQKNELSGT
jgi:hypothetical protein